MNTKSFFLLFLCISNSFAIKSNCVTPRIFRSPCKRFEVIKSEARCLARGCCFDDTQFETTLRCYKPTTSFQYQPTIAPMANGAEINLFKGEISGKILKSCAFPLNLPCGDYFMTRSSCLRQNCCWNNGECKQSLMYIVQSEETPSNPCVEGVYTPVGDSFICDCDGGVCPSGTCQVGDLPRVPNGKWRDGMVSVAAAGSEFEFICDNRKVATNFPIRTCLGNNKFDPPLELPVTGQNYPACSA